MTVKVRPYRGTANYEVDVQVMLPDGRVVRERKKAPVPSRSGARRWGEERERWLLLHWREEELRKNKKDVPTLRDFEDRFINDHLVANRRKPSTIAANRSVFKNHLLPLLGAKKLDEITEANIASLKARLQARSPKTTNNALSVLSKCLKSALRWKVIDSVPVTFDLLRAPPGTFDFLDFDDYARLVEGASKAGMRNLLLVLLCGDAGLRRGEIIALEWTDLDFRRGHIVVKRSQWRKEVTAPKGGKHRRVPMTAALKKALTDARHLRGPRVLYRDDGQVPTPRVLRNWMATAQRRAGMEATGKLHVLRHTFCSHLAMQGVPARTIQELAGHANLSTTQRYMHLTPAALEQGIRALDRRPTEVSEKDAGGSGAGEMMEKASN